MGMLCAVSFNRYGRLYYFDPGELRPGSATGCWCPPTTAPRWPSASGRRSGSPRRPAGSRELVGLAGDEDLRRDERLRRRKAEAKVAAKRLIRAHGLPMKVVGVDQVLAAAGGGERITVYFTAPHRVDFRALVRDLGATLHCRVELRQLSERDSARVQGGIGSCGRDLCCATFLTDFEPVTIRMAKDQELPLNPMRISGACGRLMCCLKYEHPLYAGAAETYPRNRGTRDHPRRGGAGRGPAPAERAVTVRRLDADGSLCSRAGLRPVARRRLPGSRAGRTARPPVIRVGVDRGLPRNLVTRDPGRTAGRVSAG